MVYDPDTDALLPAWYAEAACLDADPAAFFPSKGEDPQPAQAVCATCTVVRDCLQLALDEGHKDGVWGGMTPGQRRKLDRQAA